MAHKRRIKVLITGFGPFPGMHSNPTGELVRWVEDGVLGNIPGANISTAYVQTSWTAVADFATGPLPGFAPDIALHFGVSARARGFQVESIARNTASTSADCDGSMFHGSCLVPGAPRAFLSTLSAETLVWNLRAHRLPAEVSHDAGRYLCNMLLFMSLDQARKEHRGRLTSFIHVPPLTRGYLDRNSLVDGVRAIVRDCGRAHRRTLCPRRMRDS